MQTRFQVVVQTQHPVLGYGNIAAYAIVVAIKFQRNDRVQSIVSASQLYISTSMIIIGAGERRNKNDSAQAVPINRRMEGAPAPRCMVFKKFLRCIGCGIGLTQMIFGKVHDVFIKRLQAGQYDLPGAHVGQVGLKRIQALVQ